MSVWQIMQFMVSCEGGLTLCGYSREVSSQRYVGWSEGLSAELERTTAERSVASVGRRVRHMHAPSFTGDASGHCLPGDKKRGRQGSTRRRA